MQLLGLALIGFGIFWEIRHLNWPREEYMSFIPQLGLHIVVVGLILDPILYAKVPKNLGLVGRRRGLSRSHHARTEWKEITS